MQRLLASLIVAVLVAPWGQALPQHVHAVADHDHPEHQHGPAAHEHVVIRTVTPGGTPHIEACAAADHSRPSLTACTAPAHAYALTAATASSGWTPVLPCSTRLAAAPRDIRVHDPPSRTHTSPRAPPVTVLA